MSCLVMPITVLRHVWAAKTHEGHHPEFCERGVKLWTDTPNNSHPINVGNREAWCIVCLFAWGRLALPGVYRSISIPGIALFMRSLVGRGTMD